jgi:hypothetical protein
VTPPAEPEVRELYAMAVEMADRVSARRGHANQFYLTLQTLLLGGPALFGALGDDNEIDPLRGFLLAIVGVIVSITWSLQLRSYRDLNRAKFHVINNIEATHLMIKPFTDEWASLKKDPVPFWNGRYAELGAVERVVPAIFLIVNVGLAVIVWL